MQWQFEVAVATQHINLFFFLSYKKSSSLFFELVVWYRRESLCCRAGYINSLWGWGARVWLISYITSKAKKKEHDSRFQIPDSSRQEVASRRLKGLAKDLAKDCCVCVVLHSSLYLHSSLLRSPLASQCPVKLSAQTVSTPGMPSLLLAFNL